MSQPPFVTITRARGAPGQDPGTDFRMLIIGTSSEIPGSTGQIHGPYYQPGALVEDFGIGDGVDCGTQALTPSDDNPTPPGIYFMSTKGMSALTAGVRGSLTVSGVTGTAVVTKSSGATPEGTYEVVGEVTDDGASGAGTAIGTAGIKIRLSPDGGRTWLPTRALGTDTSIEMLIPNPGGDDFETGMVYEFQPSSSNKSALFTKLTLLQTTLTGTGHFTITSGSPAVHDAADTARDTALAAVPAATTDATAVTLFNSILSYLGAHGADDTVHQAADTTLATALDAIPEAENVADVDLYLDNLIAAYTAHRQDLTAHGTADGTNTITAYTSAPGTLKTGDTWSESKTTPPDWAVADLYTAGSPGSGALVTVAQSSQDFALIVLSEPCVAADIATISAGLTQMKTLKGTSRITVLGRFRDQAGGESDATYLAALATFRNACADEDDIALVAGDGWLTDAFRSYVYSRSGLPALVARIQGNAALPGARGERIAQAPGWTKRGPLPNFTIRDTDDNPVGHDERIRGGALQPVSGKGGFICFYYEAATGRQGTYVCVDAPTLYGVGASVVTLMDSRVSNGIERRLYGTAFDALGQADIVQASILDQDARDAMAAAAMQSIEDGMVNEFSNVGDPNLVTVNNVVSTAGPVYTVTWIVNDELFRYCNGVIVTILNART